MVPLADHRDRAVSGMNCLHYLERWDRGFEFHPRHGCLCAFILCVGSGLATGCPPLPGPRSPTDCVKVKRKSKAIPVTGREPEVAAVQGT
jgi:hypothetical protein